MNNLYWWIMVKNGLMMVRAVDCLVYFEDHPADRNWILEVPSWSWKPDRKAWVFHIFLYVYPKVFSMIFFSLVVFAESPKIDEHWILYVVITPCDSCRPISYFPMAFFSSRCGSRNDSWIAGERPPRVAWFRQNVASAMVKRGLFPFWKMTILRRVGQCCQFHPIPTFS